ncbi:aspartic peptidase domain-containing protein [Mycena rosella]|uniref:Aspartic peptidase domain-containing protein n=1 Tax=Mycena rosella TaxID=1033263 RepID=A0AAD7D4A8_MYCRO|nr:aspartic peptidase domain-containing protein [Mycena rosella]
MQLSVPFFTLLATVLALSSVDARPLKVQRRTSGMITLPMRRIENNAHIHPELRHQQHLNRAHRLVARVAGLEGPSDSELRANLERRASYISLPAKRFNIPSPDLLPPGSEVSNLVSENDVTSDCSEPTTNNALAKQSSEIDIDGADTTYVTTVKIGTPARDFAIILDSGSGDFWVESDSSCTSDNGQGCGNHTFLGEDSSSTFVDTGKPWDITYGSGSASGDLITDTVVLAGMTLVNHTFGVAHKISTSFSGDTVADGLMGLGKAALSNQHVPSPVKALANAGLIKKAITSYRFPRLVDHTNNGEITFGGLDPSKFDSSTLITIPADNQSFWIANLDGVSVDGENVPIVAKVGIMDTGTTLLVAPANDAAALHAKIPGAKFTNGGYTVPCGTNTSVALHFGGKAFPINPKDLTFAAGGRTTGDCTSGIGAFGAGADPNQWLVGDSFLKSVYFSTNEDDNTITLAVAV